MGYRQAEADEPFMSDEQRSQLARKWSEIACPVCGAYHPGMCPRVERIEYHPNGKIKRMKLRPAEQCPTLPGTILPSEVFTGDGPTAQLSTVTPLESAFHDLANRGVIPEGTFGPNTNQAVSTARRIVREAIGK